MKTKLNNQVNILTLFVRSLGFLQGVSLRSSEVVRVVRRAMDDWPATPQGSKRTTKTGNSATLKYLYLRNKPNFNSVKLTATTCSMGTYNASQPKPKNGANPNKPNQSQFQKPQNRRFSIALAKENKPNSNPIQTQSKPNSNPIQTQSKPNSNPIYGTFFVEIFFIDSQPFQSHTIRLSIHRLGVYRKSHVIIGFADRLSAFTLKMSRFE